MDLEFDTLLEDAVEAISTNRVWVLATAAKEHVSARAVSVVNSGLTLYFQTHDSYLKYRQIEQNANVALCCKNIAIEGEAYSRGNIFNGENDLFAEMYRNEHPGSYKLYSRLDGQVVIEVQPKKISFWKYIENIPYLDILDLVNKSAIREEQFHCRDEDAI
ncbi:MAG: pyridoxamine 5'-phosphate oxidase family protein [Spirochaetales bacterium]|nr:pyridoxamine 5'-phosphate oxidase family protein [Spirochaetales bacterium]